MGYYFYIAKKHLSELLSKTDYDGRFDECIVSEKPNNIGRTELTLNIFWFQIKRIFSFGNPNVDKFNIHKNNDYMLKLEYLLGNENCPKICKFEKEAKLDGFFSYEGEITVDAVDMENGIVRVYSVDKSTQIRINISCSINNFSESIEEYTADGKRINRQDFIHSGNSAFFLEKIPLEIKGVFEVIKYYQEKKELFCRALYMYTENEDIVL